MGQTSHLEAFVNQINKSLKCATPGCNGILKPVTIDLVGLGAVEIHYSCTGCVAGHVQFIVPPFMKQVSKLFLV